MGKAKNVKTYTLTEQQLKSIAKSVADETLKAYIKEEKNEAKRTQDRRLYNMRVLLENYRNLNKYAKNAIYTVEQMIEQEEIGETEAKLMMKCGLRDDDMLVRSIASGALRVKTLMAQVNRMLDIYREDCETSSSRTKQRQYRVLYDLYLGKNRMTTKEIADREGEELRTIQNDAKAAREDLTPLIFGIDGLLIKLLRE